jgi:hypothetical protein
VVFIFCARLTSFNIMSSKFIHIVESDKILCFLWMHNSLPLSLSLYHIFFMHSSIYGHLDWCHILAIVDNTAISMKAQVSLYIWPSFPLGIYLVMGFLNNIVVLFLGFFCGTSILFFIAAKLIYILITKVY